MSYLFARPEEEDELSFYDMPMRTAEDLTIMEDVLIEQTNDTSNDKKEINKMMIFYLTGLERYLSSEYDSDIFQHKRS